MAATSSRRSLAATASTAALLSTCDVLSGTEAFSPPLHAGLPPAISQSPIVTHLVRPALHLVRPALQRNWNYGSTIMQSSLIEEPPKRVGGSDDAENGDSSSSLATNDATTTTTTTTTPLEKEIDDLLKKQSETEKMKLLYRLTSVSSALNEKMGVVDESRIAFPEISTGEVPRLFSNLKYDKSADGKISASKHASGSTLGATALIAGTTLGVSSLHLPSAVAPAGFLYSSAAMLPAWLYSVMSGLLVAELCINTMGTTGKPDVKLMELYDGSLGRISSTIGTVAYFGLQFAVILACISMGGANIGLFLNNMGMGGVVDSVPGLEQLIFAGAVGTAACVVNPAAKESVNNVLLMGAVATLLGILGVGAGSADFAALIAGENQHPEAVIDSLPIIFMALGYQTVMPKVTRQLEGDKEKITTAIVAGTAIPFLLYILWDAIVLGNTMTGPGLLAVGVDPVSLLQSQGNPLLGELIGGFSEVVVAATLFSFAGNFVEIIADTFKMPASGQKFDEWKPALFAGALLPATFFAAGDAAGACKALDYAGAFSISTLFLVLPSIIIWKSRYGEDDTPLTVKPMVPFGKISLGSLWKAAGTLIVEQGAEKLGIIDFFKDNFFH